MLRVGAGLLVVRLQVPEVRVNKETQPGKTQTIF